ncbi:hypothetical protein [Arthrobacter ulcerisalmonis]
MRERARLAGGWLTAEQDHNEFLVNAFIPYGALLKNAGAAEEAAGPVPEEVAAVGSSSHG